MSNMALSRVRYHLHTVAHAAHLARVLFAYPTASKGWSGGGVGRSTLPLGGAECTGRREEASFLQRG